MRWIIQNGWYIRRREEPYQSSESDAAAVTFLHDAAIIIIHHAYHLNIIIIKAVRAAHILTRVVTLSYIMLFSDVIAY